MSGKGRRYNLSKSKGNSQHHAVTELEEQITMSTAPLLSMKDISKKFPGVNALECVNLDVCAGQVHALVGENGAGKSTLMKILIGAYFADSGEIQIEGKAVQISSPDCSLDLGINMVQQEHQLVPYLNVAENVFVGRLPRSNKALGVVDWSALYRQTASIFERLGIEVDPHALIAEVGSATCQLVEIAKALSFNARLIVLDEPSAVLSPQETRNLFKIIRNLTSKGVGVIYISHRLEEIFEIADQVTVLKDGKLVGTRLIEEIAGREELVRMMVGRELGKEFPPPRKPQDEVVLRGDRLNRGQMLKDISFELKRGEILGVAGLVGAGRTELARAIFAADAIDSGQVEVAGSPVNFKEPKDAVEQGIGLLNENRKTLGLFLELPVFHNVTIAALQLISRLGVVHRRRETGDVAGLVEQFRIKTPGLGQIAKYLSGGNQQKVLVARWVFARSKILIFDEPTRGIDVGAKEEIYRLMDQLCGEGCSIIMISSELPEILGMSDRILVMCRGSITGVLQRAEATEEKIMDLATGRGNGVGSKSAEM